MNTENRIYKIIRKRALANRHEGSLGCDRCPPHRHENAARTPHRNWKFRSRNTAQWQEKKPKYHIEQSTFGQWRGMYGDDFVRWFYDDQKIGGKTGEQQAREWLARHTKIC